MYMQACSHPYREQHKNGCSAAAGNAEDVLSLEILCTLLLLNLEILTRYLRLI